MIVLKCDIYGKLKEAGYSSYRIRKENLLGQSTLQKLREGGLPSWHEMDILCRLLEAQPGDLVEYRPDAETK